MKKATTIGIDIGGTHLSAAIVHPEQQLLTQVSTSVLNSNGSAYDITSSIATVIRTFLETDNQLRTVGIAFPGPFDYAKGVCRINGVGGKFEKMFGLHVSQYLRNLTGLPDLRCTFSNDAHCFAVGAYKRYDLNDSKAVFLTLGTGLGSAFMKEGELLFDDEDIPAGGYLYNQPFASGVAEDLISARWFVSRYQEQTGAHLNNVKDIAATGDAVSMQLFETFGTHLGSFLAPILQRYGCKVLVLGGNLCGSAMLFKTTFEKELHDALPLLRVVYATDTEECIITGAALLAAREKVSSPEITQRNSLQQELPVYKQKTTKGYDIYPSYSSEKPVFAGMDSLAEELSRHKIITIDGYQGVWWEQLREQLQQAHPLQNKKIAWYDIDAALRDSGLINEMLAANLNGDDPVFGKKYTGDLVDFFDATLLEMIRPDNNADLCIVYGTGAALANWNGLLLYVDVPKNEIQYRMRAGSILNIGAAQRISNQQAYKRFYFADWPLLNKHKQLLLPKIDFIIDGQRSEEITWMRGNDLREVLVNMSQHALRVRPWFEAGIWGGQWMKEHIEGLNKEEINYAWSFELITPENGIVIEGHSVLMETSFDMLMFNNNEAILGKAAARFGNEFPIRFDFLDTFDGGNLSVQCHPRTQYIRDHFGENFTQDETYYILDCKPGAEVYLGFQENIDAGVFRKALEDAQEKNIAVDIESFVQVLPANKHDLFLIPNGTVHASGKNNMVLEISNTPYIFTFKMYDWLRTDLNGMPRPINIEHAFNNLYFERKGDYVQEQLVSHPVTIAEWDNGRIQKLPTHKEHFYEIDRYEFKGSFTIETKGQCHCCMLVEGDQLEVTTHEKTDVVKYAETFIIPAAVAQYKVNYTGSATAFLVVAYVKNEHC